MISPAQICTLKYDYVAIFSNQLYEEIRMELVGVYFIPEDKIIPWNEIVKEENWISSSTLTVYKKFFAENGCKKILDVGMPVFSKHCLTKGQILEEENAVLDGIWSDRAVSNDCLYDSVYGTCEDCDGFYDAVLLWNRDDLDSIEMTLINVKVETRYILLYTGYLWNYRSVRKELEKRLRVYGKVFCISNVEGIMWIVDTKNEDCREDISIYVVMHKKYNVQVQELYIPLCVGNFHMRDYLTEQEGENIAYLNAKINECTALYWIWKNTDTAYVGLNHYRRYFYNNEIKSIDNRLDAAHASNILREYDIILTKVPPMGHMTVYEQIYNSVNHHLCEKGYFLMKDGIARHQPGYLQAFEDVMRGHASFLCNMFVAKREIINRYCDWLFSFLIEATERIDVEGYDAYSQRIIGFFAERMWTVWVRKNKIKIKELPYVIVK